MPLSKSNYQVGACGRPEGDCHDIECTIVCRCTPNNKGTALVTGASSGIGATYAERLAHRGYDLLLVARDEQRLAALATKLRAAAGVKVDVLKADLTAKADLVRVEQRIRTDQSIALVVNNAGMGAPGALLGADVDQLETMVLLNVVAVNRLAVAAASVFAARKSGAIVNVASVVAFLPETINGTYSASKAYVLNLTQGLHRELDGSGVQIQAVLPGLTRTEFFERAGIDLALFDAGSIMDVGEMVDAALAGFDQGELVTIPSLPNPADWNAFAAARMALWPNLSKDHAADRYKVALAAVAE